MARKARDKSGETVVDTIEDQGTKYDRTACGRIYVHFPIRTYQHEFRHRPSTIQRRELTREGPTRNRVLAIFLGRALEKYQPGN